MKRVTIFLSSPREDGNSDKLAKAFIRGARSANHKVNVVIIRDEKINGCVGCEYCYAHQGECAQQDDMQKVYCLLEETDIVVFATPIYYQGFPSQLKAVVDRLYVTENKKFPITGAVLLATYATPGHEMSEQTTAYFECLINYHKWKNQGIITVSGLDERNDIVGNDALDRAYELGYKL
mgnify:CR=1 FL=1